MDALTLLGTKGGPSLSADGPMPSSSLLTIKDRTILIDCGYGAARSLVKAGFSLTEIDAIFITHLHCDHILDLGPLIYTAWASGLKNPIKLFGPKGIEGYWENFLASMSFDLGQREASGKYLPLRELVEIKIYDEGGVEFESEIAVSALKVDHPPVDLCFALRFDTDQMGVVFSSDTRYCPSLAAFSRHADILLHEAMLEKGLDRLAKRLGKSAEFREYLMARHTMAADAGRIATSAGVKHLVLNHLIPSNDAKISDADWHDAVGETWQGHLTIGRDGLVIPLKADG